MSMPANLPMENTQATPASARGRGKWESALGAFYPSLGNLPVWILATAGFIFILVVFKVLPGHAPSAQYLISDATFAECFYKARILGIDGCLNFGFPKGAPKTFGLPVSILGSYMAKDGSVSLSSILLIYGGFLLVAYLAAIALFKRIVGFTWLAIVGALLFLGSITVHKFMEYGALGLGIALIPCYLLVDLRFLDSLSTGTRFKSMAWFAAVIAARCLAIFLDGYSFLFSCLLSITCLFFMPILAKKYKIAVIACAAYLLACGLAAAAYQAYFPSDALGSTPISGFRAQGVDVFGLVSPQTDSVYYKTLGVGENIDPLATYSDGSSSRGIFLGYAWIISIFVIILFLARKRAKIEARYVVPVVLAGLAALALSLGPSLKFKSFRDIPATSITSAHYNMPESAAVMSLPTAWIYQLPGIKNARALVRWLVLTQLALSILIVIAVLILLQDRKVVLALALTGLALLELLPDFPYYLDGGRFTYARAHTLYYDYPASLKPYVKPGERALFVELQDSPGGNQYTVNTLCTRVSIFCYNNGGDKASTVVQRHWPTDVLDARNRRHTRIAIERIFRNDLADVVIVPFFDLKLSSYSEAQGAVDTAEVVKSTKSLADGLGLPLQVGDRYAFIRPRAEARDADHADACSISCWRSWPDLALPAAPKWGPKKAIAGQPLNKQSGGRSLIWVQVVDTDRIYSLALGDTILPTQSNQKIVTGNVPGPLIESFVPGARYPLYLLDTESEKKLLLGYMRIAGPGA